MEQKSVTTPTDVEENKNVPQVEKAEDATNVKQEAQPDESVPTEKIPNAIQVSLDKTPIFYARIGKKMLCGSAEKGPLEEVVVTGLGHATSVAIGAASVMEREETATITKIETAYFNSSRARKRIPKITVTLAKHASLQVYNKDEQEETKVIEEGPREAPATQTAQPVEVAV